MSAALVSTPSLSPPEKHHLPQVVAGVPVKNCRQTLPAVLASLRAQTHPLAEILVIDDGSTDDSAEIARKAGVRLISFAESRGRGAARARILREASSPWVLMTDATLDLPPDFLAKALARAQDAKVAAVFGHIAQPPARTVAERWRGRHLFHEQETSGENRFALLATHGCLLRAAAVVGVGGFQEAFRAGEDADLGHRLLAAGWEVIAAPELHGTCLRSDSGWEVLRRYARWNTLHCMTWREYLRQVSFSLKVMMRKDWQAADLAGLALSAACPHVQFWTSRKDPTK